MTTELAVLVRWIHVLGISLLVGIVSFRWLVARQEDRREATVALTALDVQLLTVAVGTVIVTVLAGPLDLWRQVSVATGTTLGTVDRHAFGAVLAHPRYGGVWIARHGCLLLL